MNLSVKLSERGKTIFTFNHLYVLSASSCIFVVVKKQTLQISSKPGTACGNEDAMNLTACM